jgi:hypothetical protein
MNQGIFEFESTSTELEKELSEEMNVWQRPALLKKGLTNREAENIENR